MDRDRADVERDIRALVADILDVSPGEIGSDMNFSRDLGADSLDAVQIAMGIEELYGIDIPFYTSGDTLAIQNSSVSGMADFILGKKAA